MISALFKDTITIKRKSSAAQDSMGAQVLTETTIYSGIKARIEYVRKIMEYNEGGRRAVNLTYIYLPKSRSGIIEGDVVYNGSNVQIGIVESSVPAFGPHGNVIDHYELSWERP
jgi:hypothetical protein